VEWNMIGGLGLN